MGKSKIISFDNRDRFTDLGLTIAAIRKSQGMSQEQLAEKANISRSYLSAIEAPNVIQSFSVEILYNIADPARQAGRPVEHAVSKYSYSKINKFKERSEENPVIAYQDLLRFFFLVMFTVM